VVKCDFCGKDAKAVQHMITGPRGAAICSECVKGCQSIIDKRLREQRAQQQGKDGQA
jgi:ATP-dependent Clp protease ATP-binding subunit ClpX